MSWPFPDAVEPVEFPVVAVSSLLSIWQQNKGYTPSELQPPSVAPQTLSATSCYPFYAAMRYSKRSANWNDAGHVTANHTEAAVNIPRQLKNERPTWCHLLFYFTSYVLNMFRTLIYPSSGACYSVVELPHWSSCSQFFVCWRFGAAGFGWCSFCRLKHSFSLQNEHHKIPATPKAPTHNELTTRRPMW